MYPDFHCFARNRNHFPPPTIKSAVSRDWQDLRLTLSGACVVELINFVSTTIIGTCGFPVVRWLRLSTASRRHRRQQPKITTSDFFLRRARIKNKRLRVRVCRGKTTRRFRQVIRFAFHCTPNNAVIPPASRLHGTVSGQNGASSSEVFRGQRDPLRLRQTGRSSSAS